MKLERRRLIQLAVAAAVLAPLGVGTAYLITLFRRGITLDHLISVAKRYFGNREAMDRHIKLTEDGIMMGRLVPDLGSLQIEAPSTVADGVQVVQYEIGSFAQVDPKYDREMEPDQKGTGTVVMIDKSSVTASWEELAVGDVDFPGSGSNWSHPETPGGIAVFPDGAFSVIVGDTYPLPEEATYLKQPSVFYYPGLGRSYPVELQNTLDKNTYLHLIIMDMGDKILAQTINPGVRIAVSDQCELLATVSRQAWPQTWAEDDFVWAPVALLGKGSSGTMSVFDKEFGAGYSVMRPSGSEGDDDIRAYLSLFLRK